MDARKRIVFGLSTTALALGAGAGIASASHSDATPSAGGPPAATAIASYLGLTSTQLGADLKSGKTLADIAVAQGKTASGLEAAIVADATTHLDAAVAAGTLTAAQETSRLADLQSHVADIVNSSGPPAGGAAGSHGGPGGGHGDGHGGHGGPASAAVASYLGLTTDELRTDLQSGKTLTAIATAQGKTVSGLEAVIVADAKTHLDAGVAAGKLTAAEETTRLADLQSHIADLVSSTGPPAGTSGHS